MDAVEYLKTLCRMCHCECLKCEFGKARSGFETCPVWQRTHPEAAISKDGAIAICPLAISAAYRHGNGACNKDNSDTCADCKRQFWSAEVEE